MMYVAEAVKTSWVETECFQTFCFLVIIKYLYSQALNFLDIVHTFLSSSILHIHVGLYANVILC